MCGPKGEGARDSAGVSDEVEPLKARLVGKALDPLNLGLESPPCRRLAAGVQLEFLRTGVHIGPQRAHEIRVREVGGHDAARYEYRLGPFALGGSLAHDAAPSLVVAPRASTRRSGFPRGRLRPCSPYSTIWSAHRCLSPRVPYVQTRMVSARDGRIVCPNVSIPDAV